MLQRSVREFRRGEGGEERRGGGKERLLKKGSSVFRPAGDRRAIERTAQARSGTGQNVRFQKVGRLAAGDPPDGTGARPRPAKLGYLHLECRPWRTPQPHHHLLATFVRRSSPARSLERSSPARAAAGGESTSSPRGGYPLPSTWRGHPLPRSVGPPSSGGGSSPGASA